MRSVLLLLLLTGSASAGTEPVASFGSNPGALAMYEYVPAQLPANRPLVVVLHGCTQRVTDIEHAGWNALADQYGFAVVYAEQQTANNPVRCFNWAGEYGDTSNLEHGKGENASIMSMIDSAITRHDLDPARVFVTGLSAGGAFTSVMMATWPDRFAGGAIFAGTPYRCASTVNEAYNCTSPGITKPADTWGDLVRAAGSGPWPRVQIWQGTTDTTVAPVNATELVKQWTNVHDTDVDADTTETVDKLTRTEYLAGSNVVVELNSIAGMGHAVPIGGDGCAATSHAFFSDQGICSTLRAAQFFGLTEGDDPGNPPGPGSGSGSGDDEPPSSGGCATGGGFGFGMIGLVLLALRRRR